jgi:hypothetical protein
MIQIWTKNFFAGGRTKKSKKRKKQTRHVKKPDFVSRLGLHLDILGYNNPEDGDFTYIVRRAMLLRSIVKATAEDGEMVELDPSLLNGLLKIKNFKHGARSIESIIKRSTVLDGKIYRSTLPPEDQLKSHMENVTDFNSLVEEYKARTVNSSPSRATVKSPSAKALGKRKLSVASEPIEDDHERPNQYQDHEDTDYPFQDGQIRKSAKM